MHTRHTITLPNRPPLVLGKRPLLLAMLEEPSPNQVWNLLAQDADMIQLSTGVAPMPVQQELDRIIPLLDEMIAAGITAPIAIATTNPLVADQAIQAGASLIVDLDDLTGAPEMAEIAALHEVPIIARPSDLAIARAKAAGIQLILDFGQTPPERTNYPVLVGPMLPQAAISAYRAGAHILRVDDLIAITTHFQDASW